MGNMCQGSIFDAKAGRGRSGWPRGGLVAAAGRVTAGTPQALPGTPGTATPRLRNAETARVPKYHHDDPMSEQPSAALAVLCWLSTMASTFVTTASPTLEEAGRCPLVLSR